MTEIQILFKETDRINSYPSEMIRVSGEIQCPSFFPGGKGLIDPEDSIVSDKNVMVLGQDFDTLKNYEYLVEHSREDIRTNATWRNLLDFLKEVNIKPDDCFFSNAIMGVRNSDNSTGKSPAFRYPGFIHDCKKLFLFQLELQKPKLILVLGIQVARFLHELSLDLIDWGKVKTIKEVDELGKQVIAATFLNGISSKIVLLTHPSYRNVNVLKRTFHNHNGNQAEKEMVITALKS